MLKLDKLKIKTNISYIKNINNNSFEIIAKDGVIKKYHYYQKEPYLLSIKVDNTNNELIIEFTSRILKDDCINLINIDSIKQCLDNINKLRICNIDVENIIKNSTVLKCDVTKDIQINQPVKNIISQIARSIKNYNRWKPKTYRNEGIALEKVVKTKKYKSRMVIYDKHKELTRKSNNLFLLSLEKRTNVLNYFKNKLRFELNINSMVQIRDLLMIRNNELLTVLNSRSNPIHYVLNGILDQKVNTLHSTEWKDYIKELVLRDNDFNIEKVEAKIRSMVTKNTSIRRKLEPYKEFLNKINITDCDAIDVLTLVA